MIPSWVKDYIGIPYKSQSKTTTETDCLGLVELVYRNVFNIVLPSYDHVNTNDLPNVAEKMLEEEESGRWLKIDKPETGCIVLINICGYPVHVGVVLDENNMLHSLKGHNSAIERFTGAKWKTRLEGFYRYEM